MIPDPSKNCCSRSQWLVIPDPTPLIPDPTYFVTTLNVRRMVVGDALITSSFTDTMHVPRVAQAPCFHTNICSQAVLNVNFLAFYHEFYDLICFVTHCLARYSALSGQQPKGYLNLFFLNKKKNSFNCYALPLVQLGSLRSLETST